MARKPYRPIKVSLTRAQAALTALALTYCIEEYLEGRSRWQTISALTMNRARETIREAMAERAARRPSNRR